ncbi:MAG TPA: DedA family protein [bacterium]|nr:DedA family protein [bacterium]HQG44565.1 DedA family protein [bacterium]HQI47341.1 DedA family protein [bacterium]HQJ63384.1 DedA family protein [bacterium]
MITQYISELAIRLLDAGGYWSAALLMMLESMVAPVPSEAVMPFVGFLVADGKWNFVVSAAATTAGSMLGSILSYYMGYFGGKPLVLKVGKYLLLDRHDLELTEKFFARRSGTITLFFSRFIPVIRHFISIPAGMGKMRLFPFLAATLAGATLWNTFLLYLGLKLRENWGVVQQYSHQVDIVVVLLLAVLVGWFIHSRLKRRREVVR